VGKRNEGVKGKIWLIVGVVVGIAIGIGKLPYLAGAAGSLSDTAQRIVGSVQLTIIHSAAKHGASYRVVEGLAGLFAILVPGITAVVLMYAARGTLRLRSVIAVLVLALGASSFVYLPHGQASGVLLLALFVAGIALVATGPLVAAPLAAVSALIGTAFLPRLLDTKSKLPNQPVVELHQAIYGSAASPTWLRVVVLIVAIIPFAWAGRLVLR
jgi:hypothetical protein